MNDRRLVQISKLLSLMLRPEYVRMTVNRELALRVGARRGKPVLLAIDAAAAHDSAVAFYRANEFFWLADSVPAKFIRRA